GNCAGIVLYLDARPMNGLTPESCNTQDGTVRFILHRTDQSDAAWHWLLGSPNGFTRKIRISVGPSSNMALASNVQDFPLRVIPRFPFYGWLVLMAAFLTLTIVLCRRTALIRATAPPTVPVAQRPYSLSRFQMAFWFFLVIAAYLFMWLITN